LEEDEDVDDKEEDGGARCFQHRGGNSVGGACIDCAGEGDGRSSGRLSGTCDAHLDSLSSLVSVSLPPCMVVGFLASYLACSSVVLLIASSAFSVSSFFHYSKISFSFCLDL
jgi:hypothetical protein